MDVANWIIGLGVLVVLALVIGSALAFLAVCFPAPEGNRPAPPGLIARNEQARIDSLKRIAARHRGSV